jgi:hypothetical protein
MNWKEYVSKLSQLNLRYYSRNFLNALRKTTESFFVISGLWAEILVRHPPNKNLDCRLVDRNYLEQITALNSVYEGILLCEYSCSLACFLFNKRKSRPKRLITITCVWRLWFCVSHFKILNQLTDFYIILYEDYDVLPPGNINSRKIWKAGATMAILSSWSWTDEWQ